MAFLDASLGGQSYLQGQSYPGLRYRGDMIETYKLTHELYDTSNNFMKFQSNDARGERTYGNTHSNVE